MTIAQFRKAERRKAKLRCGIAGPSGSGKTFSSLLMAFGLGGRVALIDTENGSGDLYAHLGNYDVCPITAPFIPDKYIAAIKAAEEAGYDVIIIDSLSHAWAGEGGLLDMQGKIADSGKGNSYTAWRTVTPKHNALVEAMLQSKCHVIATVRSKQDYVQQKDEKTGKTEIKKVGMAPVQREGMEYEFTVFFDLTIEHIASASKDRTSLFDSRYIKPTSELGKELLAWLNTGVDPVSLLPPPPMTLDDVPVGGDPENTRAALEELKKQEAAKAAAPPAVAPTAEPAQPPAAAAPQGQPFEVDMITDDQRKKLMASFNDLGIVDRNTRLNWVQTYLHNPGIKSVKDLSKDQASRVIDALEHALENVRAQKASA